MTLAVLYDFLETIGGGERVALTLAKHLDADLITTNVDPTLAARAGFAGVNVIDLGRLRGTPPFKQLDATRKFSQAKFHGYDLYMILGNWAVYAAKWHHPNVFYCLTPTRMFYDQRDTILGRLNPVTRGAARVWTAFHRPLDRRAVTHCDRVVAISRNVRGRVLRWYRRDADVIYPPVATSRFRFREVGDAWLSVSRLYPEKRLELQFETFRRLPNEKLILVGGHAVGDRSAKYLASLQPPTNVTLLGEVSEAVLADLYARCRGFLTTAIDEDFGITPVEAMAAGKCVLATDEGGYRETVVHGRTGFLLPADPEAFSQRIRALDESELRSMRSACEARAREFDETIFIEKMRSLANIP